MKKQFIAPLFFFLFNCLLLTSLQAQEPEYFGGEAGKKLDWTLFYLNSHYVDSTDTETLAELAIIRMMQELDPFSKYQSKKQLDDQRKADEGIKNDGIGINYYVVQDTATVTYIDPTGPAFSDGLKRGDKILSLNGINTIGQNFQLIDSLILADRGTVLNFKVRRNNRPLNIPITSISLFAASVDASYPIVSNVGYIKLNRFTSKTPGEFSKAIQDLKRQGVENLIIDLRNNRGGVVSAATKLADQFLSAGQLIMTSEGKGLPKSEIKSTDEGSFKTGKVAILTNPVTASASEIFTGALQELDRAVVIGELTYGKGLIQQSYLLNDSAAVRLTIGRYFTPTGRMLQRPYQFDTTKDWIYQNIANVIHYKGFTKNLDAPAANQWQTVKGRKILKGQGGIIPDIYLTQSSPSKPQMWELNKLGLIYKFAIYHADRNRVYYLNNYKSGNEFRLDKKLENNLRAQFSAFLMANMEDKEAAKSFVLSGISDYTMTQLKAWLGPQIWESGAYYAVFNEEDDIVLRAIKAMTDGTYEELGIGN